MDVVVFVIVFLYVGQFDVVGWCVEIGMEDCVVVFVGIGEDVGVFFQQDYLCIFQGEVVGYGVIYYVSVDYCNVEDCGFCCKWFSYCFCLFFLVLVFFLIVILNFYIEFYVKFVVLMW